MKTTRKLLTIALSLVLAAMMMVGVSAADEGEAILSDAEILTTDRWQALHRWDFDGNLTDSVGGATVTPVTYSYFQEPTYENGKIKLNGNTAYTFDEALDFSATDDLKYLRVDLKGSFDWNTVQGAHRIFGNNIDGSKTCGLNFVNIAGTQYASCSMGLSTNSPAWDSFVLIPDQTKFDKTAENLYTFIFYNNHLYYYANGVLIAEADNGQGGSFAFTDFLGCSYDGTAVKYNYVGTIDYIEISMLGAEKTSGGNTSGDNADTGASLIALPVALLAVSGAVVCTRKKRLSK